jgi:beta-1,4-mannosyl-glycoprotein beta-1,4-N-acetylglucosaminyltransferase
MIWSLTPFANELDVLEIRLATLDPIVDRHVLVEASVSQTGMPKPLTFDEATRGGRFDRWMSKIRHLIVPDMPAGTNNWRREAFQRDAALRACHGLNLRDKVLISDVDEIPTVDALIEALAERKPTRIEMDMHLYRLNWRWPERPVRFGTRALVVDGATLLQSSPSQLVEPKARYQFVGGGWHLAYQGDAERIVSKVGMIADAWCRDVPVTIADAQRCIDTGSDIYKRQERQCEWAPIEDLPEYVRRHRLRFSHMLIDRPAFVAA